MLKSKFSYLLLFYIILSLSPLNGQTVRKINDKHIVNQQERMVFKQWDKNKFTPKKGFLGLNPQYWLTWGLHPNYPKVDHRPLSPSGPQTLRMGMLLAMKESTQRYKLHSDTLRSTSLTEIYNYAPQVNSADPLWNLYYKNELSPLLEDRIDHLKDFSYELKINLIAKGVLDWYIQEFESLRQRLSIAQQSYLDRGSRMLSYHRILQDYQLLNTNWNAKVQYQAKYLALAKKIHVSPNALSLHIPSIPPGQTDIQIANKILTRLYAK